MGVIQRQGIKDSVVTYLGVAFGALNTLVIYPLLPDKALGLFQYLLSAALLLTPFLQLGMTHVAVRFFPDFRDEARGHRGFLVFLLLPSLVWFLIFALLVIVLQAPIKDQLQKNDIDPLIQDFLLYVLPLAFFITINSLLIQYTKNFLRIVIPTFLDNIGIKISTGLLSLALAYAFVSLYGYITGIIVAYGVVTMGLLLYLRWLGQLYLKPDFSALRETPKLLSDIRTFAFYGIIGSIGGSLMTYLDRFMIPMLMDDNGLAENGVFTIVAYIGTTIDTPRKSLEKITAPIVSDAIQREDWAEVGNLYRRTSVNLLIFGLLLLLGIWLNLDSVFDLMPNGDQYRAAKYIVLILGITSIIDMVTSINSFIIGFSRYFRFNFYLVIILAGFNILFNYLFISTFQLGIYGAALATLLSVTIYNVLKFIFIYQKFDLQPLTLATFWILLIGLGVYAVISFLPDPFHPILNIAYKSLLITALYLTPILYFRLSPDLNDLLVKGWNLLRQRLHF